MKEVLAAILTMCIVFMILCLVSIHRYNIMFKGYDNLVLNANLCLEKGISYDK